MSASSEPETSAIHQVLIDSGADPKLIHPAIEEIRQLSGENVVTAIGAQITELRSEVQVQITELRSEVQVQITELRSEVQVQITELRSEVQVQITELRSEMKAQINGLQAQINGLRAEINTLSKVIWPLISLLFIPMLALAYKVIMQ